MMDERMIRQIQREGAEALLNAGVSVPLFAFDIPLLGAVRVRLTMERPTLADLIEMARVWLSVGMSLEEFSRLDYDGQMSFLVHHGGKISRMIALTVRRRWLPTWLLSWAIRRWMPWSYQKGLFEQFLTLMGTESFLTIISAVERMNPMKPRLSHERGGS